jgi:hypothetical protein
MARTTLFNVNVRNIRILQDIKGVEISLEEEQSTFFIAKKRGHYRMPRAVVSYLSKI